MTESLKFAADTTKQVITLSTTLVAFTVTFADKFKVGEGTLSVPDSLKVGWVLFGASVLFGILTLLALTGVFYSAEKGEPQNGAYSTNVRILSSLMILSFLAGLISTIVAGFEIV